MAKSTAEDIRRACEASESVSPQQRLRLYARMQRALPEASRRAWGSLAIAAARSTLVFAGDDLAAQCLDDAERALASDDGKLHAEIRARAGDSFHAFVGGSDALSVAVGLAAVAAVFEATDNEPPLNTQQNDIDAATADEELDPESADTARWAFAAHQGPDAAAFLRWWLDAAVARTRGEISPPPPFFGSVRARVPVAPSFDFLQASNTARNLRGKSRRLAFERVREGLEALVAATPSADAYNFLAFACLQCGDAPRAVAEIERAIAINSNYLRMALCDDDFKPLWPQLKAVEQASKSKKKKPRK
jgi:hypothetical protein